MSNGIEIVDESGKAGRALRFDGKLLEAVLPHAFAPGMRVRLTLKEYPSTTIEAKSIGSKRRDDEDGSFDVRFLVFNLRREDRERLKRILSLRTDDLGARRR